jgi:hypothetical protein
VYFKVFFLSRQHLVCRLIVPRSWLYTYSHSSNVIQAVVKFTRVLNTPMSLRLRPGWFVSIFGCSGVVWDGSLSGGFVLFLVHLCLVKPLFICLFSRSCGRWRWCLSLLSGLFFSVFYIFHPSLVVETRLKTKNMMTKEFSTFEFLH